VGKEHLFKKLQKGKIERELTIMTLRYAMENDIIVIKENQQGILPQR